MRWKISDDGHDPRQVDLLAIIVLLVAIACAFLYFNHHSAKPNTAAFIEPSQNVRW
jgi:hypothetical protein